MNLQKKKILIAKTLGVGKERIVLNKERLGEIKEAITRQDIRDLFADKAIAIKPIHGRKRLPSSNTRRREGSVRQHPKHGKSKYVIMTRKLRAYLAEMKAQEKINAELYQSLRKDIRASKFRSKSHMKEHMVVVKK